MNIKEAKEQIKNAIVAYFTKDADGEYIVPIEKQRPVFLMGPPGIGKTAIMEQIAAEMGVGLLSYSMTHHTRQSALGLPFIEHKNYKGMEYDVSEYTMSEIISSVYEMMETTGVEEGILFLDEINCVSETLAPIMLQFLQYKVFGRHKVPDGWIVVTAGNPPEYNNSVREFDIVTWDRLKRVDCEPDYDVWKEYAYKKRVHPAVTTYLDVKKSDFYRVESTVDGKTFITARGWDDLSQMIQLYEMHDLEVDEKLIRQYVQNPKIAKSFAIYYDLFKKYRSDYQVDKILAGKADATIKERARSAKFDERLAVLGLMIDAISGALKDTMMEDAMLKELMNTLKDYQRSLVTKRSSSPYDLLLESIAKLEKNIEAGKKAQSLSVDDIAKLKKQVKFLEVVAPKLREEKDPKSAFNTIKLEFSEAVKGLKKGSADSGKQLSNVFKFCEEVFEDGQEMLILVTEMTANYHTSMFISRYGCKEYFQHNKELLFYERQKDIMKELDELNLDDSDLNLLS